MKRFFADIVANALVVFIRLITAPRAIWAGSEPVPRRRVYFANHTSNADFVLIWGILPAYLRRQTRPVAASDYWLKSALRAFAGRDVFRAVLINRDKDNRDPEEDPVAKMAAALEDGDSLILFPEGLRNLTDEPVLPFKTGIYHLAKRMPEVDFVPTWINNLNSVLPKGEVVPVPLICTVTYGAPLHIKPNEERDAFLGRAREALQALAAQTEGR